MKPGLKIIKTPIKPNPIAAHRLHPTFSLRIKTDKAVTINGPAENIEKSQLNLISKNNNEQNTSQLLE